MIHDERLDCDWEEANHIKAALTHRQARCLRIEAELLDRLGFGGEYLDAAATAEAAPTDRYVAGLRYSDSAQINPAKLCRELKRVLLERGVSVHELTAVKAVTPGRPPALELESGRVIADRVVLGTNAYLPQLGVLRGRVVPLQTHVRVTEPLSDSQLAGLGWSRRESISDKRNIFNYYRLTRDNRIVFGGGRPVYGRAGDNRSDGATDVADPRVWHKQRLAFAALFPTLRDVRATHEWSGSLGMTVDMLPVIGEPAGMPGVTVAGGWCGHGVALSFASGALVAELVAGRGAATASLPWRRGSAPRIPGDPLRAVGLSAYLTALQLADAAGALLERCRRRPSGPHTPTPGS
jgi:gamma-glutamylputrescine oxidase